MKTIPSDWPAHIWFGFHYDLHAGQQDTELGKEVTPRMLRRVWRMTKPDIVQCDCKGHPGWTSWPTRVGSPSPGIVKDALQIHRQVTQELGIPLVMHYSGVWDTRAVTLHPEWAVIGPDGKRHPNYTCPLSGYVDRRMIPQLRELIDRYDVDGFWVDGDCWACLPCYCARCRRRFLKEHGFRKVPCKPGERGWREWLTFGRQRFFGRTRRCAEAVHARRADCKYCSNWAYSVRMPDEMSLPVDFLSGDFSWRWSVESVAVETRFISSHGTPWNLMAWSFSSAENAMQGWTTKSLPALCQEAAAVMAQGGGFLLYENPLRSGHLVEWRHRRFARVAQFCRERQPYCQFTETVPQVALLHAARRFYAHSRGEEGLFGVPPEFGAVYGALLALLETHHSVDILNEGRLLANIHRYPVVVMTDPVDFPDSFHAVLNGYVQQGGCLVLAGADLDTRFMRLGGLVATQVAKRPAEPSYRWLPVDGEAVVVRGPWRTVKCREARPVWRLLHGPEPERQVLPSPAATLRTLGRGRVLTIPGPLFDYYQQTHYPKLRDVVRHLMALLNPTLKIRLQAPPRLEVVLRQKDERLFVNLLNRGADHPLSPNNVMVENVPSIDGVRMNVRLDRRPSSVRLQPGNRKLAWSWKRGELEIGAFTVGIHDIVEIGRTRL